MHATDHGASAPRGRTGRKVATSIALLALLAGLVGMGAFATFTDAESASQTVSSGTVVLDPVNVNGPGNRLTVGASDIAAGDTIARAVIVKNTGTIDLATVNGLVLDVAATTSSALDTPASADTLKVDVDRCTIAWTEAGPPYTYTCGGSATNLVSGADVVGSWDLSSGLDLTAGVDNYLVVTLTLPTSAPNGLQGLSSTLEYTFTATQRAGAPQ